MEPAIQEMNHILVSWWQLVAAGAVATIYRQVMADLEAVEPPEAVQ
jgi:hypothetical protein